MRRHRLNPKNLKDLVQTTLQELIRGKRSVTISVESLLKLNAPKKEERPKIIFTELAYQKMKALVANCPKEIAWHGLVDRLDDRTYKVYDILVYPQIISGATVDSDDKLYPTWLDALPDEQFNAVRLQGHSHVNMTASPSGTDDSYYETLIQHIKNYYIFIILNKSGNHWVNLYDIESNIVYESSDIDVVYEKEGFDYDAWYKENFKDMVDEKVYTVAAGTPLTPEYYSKYYQNYEGYYADKKKVDSKKNKGGKRHGYDRKV